MEDNRALDAAEVTVLYGSRTKRVTISNGLIAHWTLDEGADGSGVSYVLDRINRNNGTVSAAGLLYKGETLLTYV